MTSVAGSHSPISAVMPYATASSSRVASVLSAIAESVARLAKAMPIRCSPKSNANADFLWIVSFIADLIPRQAWPASELIIDKSIPSS